jgi:pyrroloquinoline quinone biosynthesis protein B
MAFRFPSPRHLSNPQHTEDDWEKPPEGLIKILGTAQDGGIPQIGCYCRNCQKAREDRSFARLISSLAILDFVEDKAFIIDTTPDLRVQYDILHERMGWEKIGRRNVPDGILLTHAHIGHYPGLMFYGYESLSSNRIPVYCSERMARFLTENGPWSQLVSLKNISLQIIEPGQNYVLTSGITFAPFFVPHRDEFSDTLGFRLSGKEITFLYIPDIQSWHAWNRSIVQEVKEVDIALLDGTFFGPEELPGRDTAQIGHPFISTSIEILKEAVHRDGKKVCFTHLNHSNLALDPQGQARRFVQEAGFEIASEGMEFPL